MRILLTNDDGMTAEGLSVLEGIAGALSEDLWIVAPELEQSGKGRAISITEPVRSRTLSPRRFAVSGTPTDCVLLAVTQLMDGPPDLILSGVNAGQNLASDTSMSGTVGAAFLGSELGIRSVAMSQTKGFRQAGAIDWALARERGADVLRSCLDSPAPVSTVLNVNFPDCDPADCAGIELTRQGLRDMIIYDAIPGSDPRGKPLHWIAPKGALSDPPEGTDLRAIYSNRISITPLQLDMTDHDSLRAMREAL